MTESHRQATALRQWSGKTDGTTWMQRSLVTMFRFMPLLPVYGIMALVVPFYMLFRREGYLAIYHYFRQRWSYSPLRAFFGVYHNHFLFGQVVLDRFAAFAGKQYHCEIEHLERFNQLADSNQGFLMLSSHVGCFEIGGCMLTSQKTVNAVVFAGETSTVRTGRENLLTNHNMRLIPVRDDMSHLFAINAALDRNEIVSMPADRVNGSSKAVRCSFLGAEASFPRGAFALAKAKGVPILAVFVMKEGMKRYRFFLERVDDATQFASALESVLHRYPAQWFNFYEFWKQ